jgi:RNA polymerase primary sigma factor
VDAVAVRTACEQADVPMPRMKAVLRALDDAGIIVEVPAAPTSRRAVAAASTRTSASASAAGTKARTAKKAPATAPVADEVPAQGGAVEEGSPVAKPKPSRQAKGTAAKAAKAKAAPQAAGAAAGQDADPGEDADEIPAEPEGEELVVDEADLVIEDLEEAVEPVVEGAEIPEGAEIAEGAVEGAAVPAEGEVKPPEEDAFVLSDDDDDAPAQQVATAGATADPVKDYLKQIGKVALLNAEQEVELAKRIEAGLFAEEQLNSGAKLDPKLRSELLWIAEDGRRAKNHLLEANLRWSSRWPSATPVAACSSST